MQLLSVISLYELSHLSSFIKSTQTYQASWQSQRTALQILKELEENFSAISTACFIETSSVTWVEGLWVMGCKGEYKGCSYVYFVELLDSNSCDFIDINHTLTAKYYKITLKLLSSAKGLQSVVVQPGTSSQSCQGEPHQVKIGRQQWREILQKG